MKTRVEIKNIRKRDSLIELPTGPFAVIAPPEGSDHNIFPLILLPVGGELKWFTGSWFQEDLRVSTALNKHGWCVVFEGVRDEFE